MKKKYFVAVACCLILFFFVKTNSLPQVISSYNNAEIYSSYGGRSNDYSIMPSSLRVLEDEAFSGTDIRSVLFGNELISIGDKAFFSIETLADVYISNSLQRMGIEAFPSNTVFHGIEGSYLQNWAETKGYKFVVDDIWNCTFSLHIIFNDILSFLLSIVIPIDIKKRLDLCWNRTVYVLSMRPQDRPELHPIDFRFP